MKIISKLNLLCYHKHQQTNKPFKMFKYFAVVFAALLAVVAAKPSLVAPAVAYSAAAYPAAYSAYGAAAYTAYGSPYAAAAYSPYYAGYGSAYRYY
ncbi:uncharacterized protein LOC123298402 isoform X1 [Chrysoperla carnea]|uniref:uncharacterized protein LOC123298402 isoform X1 n=1 Tax=Chrysoperla carnea TaxID=189513 RepID=UPI001D081979|nr:uncharacterized protein LOC123298402 isoform X1 [Chrysoperla carnea]